MDLDEVLWYEKSRFHGIYEDPARAYKIMRKLLDNDEDRKNLTIMSLRKIKHPCKIETHI